MFPSQIAQTDPDKDIRCKDSYLPMSEEMGGNKEDTKVDAALSQEVDGALWKDDVLRAIERDQIGVHVKNGAVHLTGHIVNTSSQIRIMNAIRTVPGLLVINNNLILDEKLTLEVATSLGILEHTHDCKFFTGTSHGVVSLNGVVSNEEVKLLAEKCAAGNQNVRGVINNVHVSGSEPVTQNQPFLQPAIGESIYFLDGISGVVKQVIINPNNRLVTAMTIQGNFNEQRNELHSPANGTAKLSEQLIVVPMKTIRYLTEVSGFLYINSTERNLYQDFDPASYYVPNRDWTPPYPYCPDDVLFPVEYRTEDIQIAYGSRQPPFEEIPDGKSFKEQVLANDSLGG